MVDVEGFSFSLKGSMPTSVKIIIHRQFFLSISPNRRHKLTLSPLWATLINLTLNLVLTYIHTSTRVGRDRLVEVVVVVAVVARVTHAFSLVKWRWRRVYLDCSYKQVLKFKPKVPCLALSLSLSSVSSDGMRWDELAKITINQQYSMTTLEYDYGPVCFRWFGLNWIEFIGISLRFRIQL